MDGSPCPGPAVGLSGPMHATLATLALGSLLLVSCGKREEVRAEETRRLTMRDESMRLGASADERFGTGRAMPPMPPLAEPSGGAPLVPAALPEGWEEKPGNAIRLLNYGFGDNGEVYLSMSRGGVLENVNRWLRQFGGEALDAAGLAALDAVQLPGYRGVWVEAEGTYAAGMGRPPAEGYALAGIVAEGEEGILTVKMIGPRAEVAAEREHLQGFVASLAPGNE